MADNKTLLRKLLRLISREIKVSRADEPVPTEESGIVNIRGVDIDKKTFDDLFRPIAFGEASNRPTDKKELEARVILNTTINRVAEHQNRKTGKSFADILTEPNAYQAYGGKQYNLYNSDQIGELDAKKKTEVNTVLDKLWSEVSSGKFEDNTNNAFYYIHNPDSSITYDDKRPLFK